MENTENAKGGADCFVVTRGDAHLVPYAHPDGVAKGRFWTTREGRVKAEFGEVPFKLYVGDEVVLPGGIATKIARLDYGAGWPVKACLARVKAL